MSPEIRNDAREVRPLRPDEVVEERLESIPDDVVTTFNEMITEKIVEGRAIVNQDEVVERLEAAGLGRGEIFDKGWLNVEEIYREAGWDVSYSKPAYNETSRPYFTFEVSKAG